jgi:hypothetical protein
VEQQPPVTAPVAQPVAPPPSYGRRADAGWVLIRLGMVVVAMWLVVLARGRLLAAERKMLAQFESDFGGWFAFVALAILAGVVFGLAVVLPKRRAGYRWTDLLALGLIPFLFILVGMTFVLRLGGTGFPGWFERFMFREQDLFSFDVTLAAAILLGIAIAVGLRGRESPLRSDQSSLA